MSCEKHKMQISSTEDYWLMGWIHYLCENCPAEMHVDRFVLYLQMTGSRRAGWR